MEIKNENIIAAYNAADDSGKQMLRAMFPDMEWNATQRDNRPVTERIKTFEDALEALGEDNHFVIEYRSIDYTGGCLCDIEAYMKLRIICAAMNEGWEPQFTEDEDRWYPWFLLYTDEELDGKSEEWKRDRCLQSTGEYRTSYAGIAAVKNASAPSSPAAGIGSRICLKSNMLAEYVGKTFIDLWMDLYLIRK